MQQAAKQRLEQQGLQNSRGTKTKHKRYVDSAPFAFLERGNSSFRSQLPMMYLDVVLGKDRLGCGTGSVIQELPELRECLFTGEAIRGLLHKTFLLSTASSTKKWFNWRSCWVRQCASCTWIKQTNTHHWMNWVFLFVCRLQIDPGTLHTPKRSNSFPGSCGHLCAPKSPLWF